MEINSQNIFLAPVGTVQGVADSLNRVGLVRPGCQCNPGSRTDYFFNSTTDTVKQEATKKPSVLN